MQKHTEGNRVAGVNYALYQFFILFYFLLFLLWHFFRKFSFVSGNFVVDWTVWLYSILSFYNGVICLWTVKYNVVLVGNGDLLSFVSMTLYSVWTEMICSSVLLLLGVEGLLWRVELQFDRFTLQLTTCDPTGELLLSALLSMLAVF